MPWEQLSQRLTELPLVICGPVLRHTEPGSVTVWAALKEQRTITFRIYARSPPGSLTDLTEIAVGTAPTVELGEFLHVVAVTARPLGNDLAPGELYFYNLFFSVNPAAVVPDSADNLASSGIINPLVGTSLDAPSPTRLSYSFEHRLPSFSLPPLALDKLRLIHGSCRKPGAEAVDALPTLDAILTVDWPVPDERPHSLLFMGDQIYADDVTRILLFMLIDAAKVLLGWEELLPGINKRHTDPDLHPGKRTKTVIEQVGFTSEDTESHLLGMGEFCAMYLFTWSDVLWPEVMPEFEDVYPGEPRNVTHSSFGGGPPVTRDSKQFASYKRERARLEGFRKTLPLVRRSLANVPIYMMFDDHDVTDDWYLARDWCEVVLGKPLGRRVVQNALLVYAVFQSWGNTPDRFVQTTSPGKALLDAADAWSRLERTNPGNSTDIAQRLDEIRTRVGLPPTNNLFTTDSATGEDLLTRPQGALEWHFRIERRLPPSESETGTQIGDLQYEIIFLDTRTRRAYAKGAFEPPISLIGTSELQAQLGQGTSESAISFVVSPTPVISYPFFEHWLVRRLFPWLRRLGYLLGGRKRHQHPVYDPELGDHWKAPRNASFEFLLASLVSRLPTVNGRRRGPICVLTGDIHSCSASRLTYAGVHSFSDPAQPQPSPIDGVVVQLTSSSFKKQTDRTRFLHNVGYEFTWVDAVKEKLGGTARDWKRRLPDPKKWIGWRQPLALGISPGDVGRMASTWQDFEYVPWMMRDTPPMLKLQEVKDQFIPRAPDWRYRIDFFSADNDVRSPASFEPLQVHAPSPGNRTEALRSYLAMAKNHHDYARKWGNGKEVVGVNNLGEISLQWEAQTTLSNAANSTDGTLSVQDPAPFPAPPFRIMVEAEVMEVRHLETTQGFGDVQRGLEGTQATAHPAGATIQLRKAVIQDSWWRLKPKESDDEPLPTFPLSKFRVSLEFDGFELPVLPGETPP